MGKACISPCDSSCFTFFAPPIRLLFFRGEERDACHIRKVDPHSIEERHLP